MIDDGRWPGGMRAVWPPEFDGQRWCVPLGEFRGWVACVTPMLYSDRLTLSAVDDVTGYQHGWCYPKGLQAALAAVSWRVHRDDLPVGYLKQATPGLFTTASWAL